MNPDERRQASDLDRQWDAFMFETPPAERTSLDREAAALLAQMWAWSAPPHRVAARERVWQRLQQRRDEEDTMVHQR